MNVSGEFDLQASFTNFVHGTKGEAGLRLATLLDDSLQRIELSRNAGNDQQQKLKTQISILKPDGQREYFDRWSTSEVNAGLCGLFVSGLDCITFSRKMILESFGCWAPTTCPPTNSESVISALPPTRITWSLKSHLDQHSCSRNEAFRRPDSGSSARSEGTRRAARFHASDPEP